MEDNRKKNNDKCIKMSQWDADEHREAFDVVLGGKKDKQRHLVYCYATRAVPIGKAKFLI